MKRCMCLISVFSILLLLCACGSDNTAAEAPVEVQTLQPLTEVTTKPAEVKPEDGSEPNSVGRMAFYPNNVESMYALAGTNTFTLYFENKGITLGADKKIGIYQKDSGAVYATINTSDASRFYITDMDSVGTSLTGWTEGTKIEMFFDRTFLPGGSYYVNMDEGCFVLGSVFSKVQADPNMMTFGVKNYGVDLSNVDLSRTYNVGEMVSFNVMVDGTDASLFSFREYDESMVRPNPLNSPTSALASISFLQNGKHDVTVAFYNAGKIVDSLTLTFMVAESSAATPTDAGQGTTTDSTSSDSGSGIITTTPSASGTNSSVETTNNTASGLPANTGVDISNGIPAPGTLEKISASYSQQTTP